MKNFKSNPSNSSNLKILKDPITSIGYLVNPSSIVSYYFKNPSDVDEAVDDLHLHYPDVPCTTRKKKGANGKVCYVIDLSLTCSLIYDNYIESIMKQHGGTRK